MFEVIEAHVPDSPDAYCFSADTHLYLSFKPDNSTSRAEAILAMENCIADLSWSYTSNKIAATWNKI